MQYKIYTLQHQKLYEEIRSFEYNGKFDKIVEKELIYLSDRTKDFRRDFSSLSKIREIDALFSDLLIRRKKKTYSIEHLVVIANKVYVLERKKSYDNQKQLLKEKASHLQKILGRNIVVNYFILVDGKSTKQNFITMERFSEICAGLSANDAISHRINDIVQKRHVVIDVEEYLNKKYNIDICKLEVKKEKKFKGVMKDKIPFVSKYKGSLSFTSSIIIFLYMATSYFSYMIYAKDKAFKLTIGMDLLFLFLLINILKEIESKLPKLLKSATLMSILSAFIYFFGRVIYYYY